MQFENLNINLRGDNLDITPAIEDYVITKVTNLGKILQNVKSDVVVMFDVGKTTNHHKNGDVFQSSCTVSFDGNQYYADATEEDLYASVDAVKNKLFKEIKRSQGKNDSRFKRGSRRIKKMLRLGN